MDGSPPIPPSLQDINYDSDGKIFDMSFFKIVNSYAKSQELMKLTSLEIKERPSPDLILRELLNSQLPDGTLAYPIEIQEIISNCISSFISEPFEGMSLFERRFAIIDEKIADHFQIKNSSENEIKKNKSNESKREIPIENSLSGIMFYSFANTIDFSTASTDFVINFLKSIENIFLQQFNKSKLEVSKSAIYSTNKVFRQIYSNEKFNNIPELNYLTQNLSFLLAKILNTVNPLLIHFKKILKYRNSIQLQHIDFDKYLPPTESTFCKNLIVLKGVKKIKHISYANLHTLTAIADDNSLYFINTSDFSCSKKENIKITSDKFAISLNYILEKTSQNDETYKLYSIDQSAKLEKNIVIPIDQRGHLLFVWGDNDVFHFITEIEVDKFGYFYFKAPDGKLSEMRIIHFKFPKGSRKLTHAINLENGGLLLNFDNSPFDVEYDLEKEMATKELGSTFCSNKNCVSATYRGEQYTYIRNSNEIFLNINTNSLIPHFQDYPPDKEAEENCDNDDCSNEDYITTLLGELKLRLTELLDKIISDATASSIPYLSSSGLNKFFTDESKSAIEDILPICFDIISSDQKYDNVEFLDVLILILIACLYSNSDDLEDEQRLKILDLYEKIFFSDLPVKYPQLQTHIILSLTLSMHTLYSDDYSFIKKFFDAIIQNPERLNNFQNSNCMLILCQMPAILYIVDEHFYEILLEHFPSKIIQSLMFKIINSFFKEISNVKSHKIPKHFLDVLIPYLMGCANQSYDSSNDYFKILFQIAIQMLSLKDNFLPFAFAEIVAPKLPLIYQNLVNYNKLFKESEERYSNLINHDYKKQTIQYVFESQHYSSQRPTYQLSYQFPGASEIQVIFDKRCRITQQTDFTIEYIGFDGQKVTKKIMSERNRRPGLTDFTIPSNAVTINYRTNRYQYAWGVHVTFKAEVLADKFEFAPDFTQFLFSYFTHLIGKYLGCGLISLPMTEREEECKVLLQSNILQHTTPDQMLLIQQNQSNQEKDSNLSLKPKARTNGKKSDDIVKRKSISRGLSFNISESSFPSEILKGFLNDINSAEFKKDGAASVLFEHMYKKVPCRHRTRIVPEISAVEKAAAAVMIKHLGVASEALSYAQILSSEPNTPVPPNLHRIWQALYKIRLQLYNLMQHAKINSTQTNNNNDNNNNNNNNSDMDSLFLGKTNECLLKCNFLLSNEPILRIMINESKENYEKKQTMEIAINELVNFIMSSVKFTEIKALVELRKERFAIRMRALNLIHQLSKELGMVTNATLINSIIPIITRVLQDKSDINSLPLTMINEFNQSISALFTHFIDSFLDVKKHLLVRLTYANALSAPFIKYFNDEQIEKTINDLKTLLYENITNNDNNNNNNNNNNNSDVIPKSNLKSFGYVICMLIAKMSLSVSSNILPLFSSFLKDDSMLNEEVTNLLILVMTYLIQSHPEFQFDDIKYLLKMLSNESILPRVASSIFYFIGQYLCSTNISPSKLESFKFKFHATKMNFNAFVKFILKNIGQAYLKNDLDFITETSSIKECNLFIADEMISFIRLLLSPISKVANEVQSTLHEILSEQLEKRTNEAAGCLLVLGFGVHSLKYSSNAVLTSKKAKANKVIVEQYIPEVGQFLISQKGETVAYKIDATKPFAQPHTEIPTSFVLTEKECQSLSKILLDFDDSLFTSLVTSYLPIAVQIKENSSNLLKYLSFDQLLKMSLKKTHDKSFMTINQLCDDILSVKEKFKLTKNLISLYGANVTDDIATGFSVFSIDADSYEIEVIEPGTNFYFGFLSENQSISATQQITEIDITHKLLKSIKSQNQNNNSHRNSHLPDSDSDDSDTDSMNENQAQNQLDNDKKDSNNDEGSIEEKEKLLNSFSKRQYHVISPSKNLFTANNKYKPFPFMLNGKIQDNEIQKGDRFICSLFENTVYFTFCKNNRTFYLKSSNSDFIPIINTENAVLRVTPLEKPTSVPKYNNIEPIDLSVARYSRKKQKIKKLDEKIQKQQQKQQDDNEDMLINDSLMQSMFDSDNQDHVPAWRSSNNNNNRQRMPTEVIIEEEEDEEQDEQRESEEIMPSASFNIPLQMVTPIESIETDDSLIASIQTLMPRSSSADSNSNSNFDNENQDEQTLPMGSSNNNNNNERTRSHFLRGRRDRPRSQKSIKKRMKWRNLKKKQKRIQSFNFSEPYFIGSTVQIDKIKTMIYNRRGEIDWDEEKNHLFNRVGTITSIQADKNKKNTIAEVEFIDKTTGKKEIIKININLINVLSIPSIHHCSSIEDFGKEKRKSFSIRMLRYATILALENSIDFENESDHSLLKEITTNEDLTNLLILLSLELITPNHNKDSLSSFSNKLNASSNLILSIQRRRSKLFIPETASLLVQASSSSSSLLMYNDLVVPGHQKDLSKHLCGMLKLICDYQPNFLTILVKKVVSKWPRLQFEELLKYAPNELNFDVPYITKNINLNFTYTDTSCVGYFFLLSPESNLSGQNILHITGDEKYKQEITSCKASILCNCFTTDKKITIAKKLVPSKKDKIHFAIIPIFKHICGTFSKDDDGNDKEELLTLLKSPASYLHIYRIISNLSLSVMKKKKKNDLFNIFVNDLIPSIVKQLKENDIFTLAVYYDTLSTLLQQLDFQNSPLPMSINKDFDDFIKVFDIFDELNNRPNINSNQNENENENNSRVVYNARGIRGRRLRGRGMPRGRRVSNRNNGNLPTKNNLPKIPLHIQQFIAIKILLRKVSSPIQTQSQTKPSLIISKKSLNQALEVTDYGKKLTNFDEIAKCQNELPQIRPYLANAELCYSLTCSPIFPHYIILNEWISKELDDTLYTGDAFNFECTVYNPNASSLTVEIEDIKTKSSEDSNKAVKMTTVSSSSNINMTKLNGRKNCRSQISIDLSSLEIRVLDPYTKDLLATVPLYGSATISSNYFIIVSKRRDKSRPSSSQEMKVRVKVANLNNYGKEKIILNHLPQFANDVRQYETKWSPKIDESVMQLFSPSDRIPSELPTDYSTMFPVLRKVDKKLLDIRLSLIQRFNNNLHSIFAMTDIKDLNLPLTRFIINSSSSILFKEKEKKIWNEVNHRNRIQINLIFNRSKAALYLNNPKNPNGKSLLSQLIDQIPVSQLTILRQPSCVPWHVDLQGEGASDAGGPGREIFSQMCNDIMDIRSGIFSVTPNRRRGSGPNQDVLIPNVKSIYKQTNNNKNSANKSSTTSNNNNNNNNNNSNNVRGNQMHRSLSSNSNLSASMTTLSNPMNLNLNLNSNSEIIDEEKLSQFVYIGALMACAYISKLPQPFCFSDLIWSYLVGREVSAEDIYAIDEEFYQSMNSIKMCGPEVPFSSIYSTLNFTVENSFGETVELINGGTFINVDYDNRLEYCRLCEEFRINEFNLPLQKIREGLMMLLNEPLVKLLCPWELRLLLCGKMEIPIDELRKVCKINCEKQYEDMLFNVLERFSSNERMLFIKFATGRMSLPPPGLSWTSPLNVRFDNRGPGNPDHKLPYAATCSSSITIPLYSNEEVMEKMLKIAINYGGDIDQDNEPDLSEIVSLS
ncbi:hypothetical protein M9Y10_043968 [Tritrichomonas musculus]|uniref:HECT domain-containing protein n=1 Tax=Tritrichomonas musculus TaxID=1915356 RepID=A0ABR2K1N5_9EUKA